MVLVSLLTHHLRLPSVSDKEIESLILFLVFFSELQVEEGAGLTLARYSAVIMKQTDRQTDRQTDCLTFTPFVSSSSKFPISNASAAFTSPRGGSRGGVTC